MEVCQHGEIALRIDAVALAVGADVEPWPAGPEHDPLLQEIIPVFRAQGDDVPVP